MHAGELGDPRNPRDALLLGAERIGHGVKLHDDPVALEYARKLGLGVEINLVSNIRLRAARAIEEHPFLDYLRLGLGVSLSTDDEGMEDTSMNHECEEAVTHTNVTEAELKKMTENSIETSFADQATRAGLLVQLRASWARFESRWKSR
jgi:adenosine deaminase